jgi:RNA polymerase sigma-70 factor (ECF subfamily)
VDASERAAFESSVASLCDDGQVDAATTLAIEGYGPELFGLIVALVRNEEDAADIFSALCERIWRGLPTFERRSSLRTWLYQVAHHEMINFHRRERRHRARAHHDSAALARVEQQVRTRTITYLRSQTRSRFAELRSNLPLEDQTLLILRVDRDLDWNDIVAVMHDGEVPDAETHKRESARLRKRFQAVKERLRSLAESEGILEGK